MSQGGSPQSRLRAGAGAHITAWLRLLKACSKEASGNRTFSYPESTIHIHLPREIAFQGPQADKKWQVINEALASKDKWPPEDGKASEILTGVMQANVRLTKTSHNTQARTYPHTH